MIIHGDTCVCLCSVFRDCKRTYWGRKVGRGSEMLGRKNALVLIGRVNVI